MTDINLQESSYTNDTFSSDSDTRTPLRETSTTHAQAIRDSVVHAMSNYFAHLDGQDAFDVYNMVLAEVEAPLLEAVMNHTQHNQTKASILLGLNRGTLRKKLKQYGMM